MSDIKGDLGLSAAIDAVNSVNPFQPLIKSLSELIGMDIATCKMLVCLVLSLPVSAVFKRLPDSKVTLKNLFIITVAAVYMFMILEITTGFAVLFGNAAFTYLISRYYRSKLMPWVNFIVLMLLLCINHLRTQFTRLDPNGADIDITGAQMVLVMKLSSYGWSYQDGLLYQSDRARFNRELNQFQRSRAILKQPPILSYLGYVFFYASIVTGPSFDFADYERFIVTEVFDDVPPEKRAGRKHNRKIPKNGGVALKKILEAIFFAGCLFGLRDVFTVPYILSTEFTLQNLLFKIGYLWLLGFVERLKYYVAWLTSEASCIVCGLGYNGYDYKTKKMYWNRVQNVDPYAFETGQNVHDCFEAWNMNTNKWLKNFVYLRVCNKDPKTGKPIKGVLPTFLAFLTSAFWHGTMPGYYMAFIAGAIIQTVGKLYRRNLRPMFISKDGTNVSRNKKYYDIVCWLVTQSAFGYICQPFVILEAAPSWRVWKTCYFWVHVGSLISLILFDGPPSKTVKAWCRERFLVSAIPEPAKGSVEAKEAAAVLAEETKEEEALVNEPEVVEIPVNGSEESLPQFDNQDELHDNAQFPDLDDMSKRIETMQKEMEEFKNESMGNKNAQELTDAEVENLKKALQALEGDVGYYINSLDEMQKEKKQ